MGLRFEADGDMMSGNAPKFERLDQIRSYIERERKVTVSEIAEQFGISGATVRRTMGELAERGEISRFRGGAIALKHYARELPALERETDQGEAKQRIGKAAAGLVHDGETVFLGSGTTALEVARNLTERKDLTVLTNSLLVIQALLDAPDVAVIALGGQLRRSELSFIGYVVEQALQEMRATKVIMGIRAIHPEQGLMNDYLPETVTDRAILKMGGQVLIVADHTKCMRVAPAFVAPVTEMDTLITDTLAPDQFVSTLTARNINVIRV